jgi:hypothetical protein
LFLFRPFFRFRDKGIFLLDAANPYLGAATEKDIGGNIVVTHSDSVGQKRDTSEKEETK